jgi:RNA polymerase sigma factor (sigma-70 family)
MTQENDVENPYQSPKAPMLADGELLLRFTADRDQSAFEELVRRYGTLVWSVCRRTLSSRHDAEDAFQATFLILVERSESIRNRKSLRSWLFGVARRVAMKTLRAQYRRLQFLHRLVRKRELDRSTPMPVSDEIWRQVEEELAHLPRLERAVIQKCVLEGQSYRQVSEELGIPPPTVASHLRRGRNALSKRLLVRGVGVAGVVAAMTILTATEAPSPSVCAATVQNAELLLAGDYASLPARIVSLMKGVATSMTITAKYVLALVLTLTGGATTWWMSSDNADQQPSPAAHTVEAEPSIEPTLVLDQHPSALEVTIDVPGPVNGTPTIEAALVLNQSPSALELNVDVPGPVNGTPTIELVPSYR